MTRSNLIALTAAASLALTSASVFAQNDGNTSASIKSTGEIIQMLESEGYTRIDEIDRDMDRYDIEATAPDGQRVELTVDGANGDIMRSERED